MKKGRVSGALAVILVAVMGFTCGGPPRDKEAAIPESARVSGIPIPPVPPPINGNYVVPVDDCPPPENPKHPSEFDNVVYITASSTLVPYSIYVAGMEGTETKFHDEQMLGCDDYNTTITYFSGARIEITVIVNGAGEQFCRIQDGLIIFNDAATYNVENKPSYAFCRLTTSR